MTTASSPPPLDPAIRSYLADSYPRNHNYRILRGWLVPSWRLFWRYRRIQSLYPSPLTSLVDLSSNKGYFCLHAAQRLHCSRVLGIDVSERDVLVSIAAREHLRQTNVHLEQRTPSELATSIERFGGPFQTALLINVYHYLFFGSRSDPRHFDSHAEIFRALRTVCDGTLVFSNCTSLEQLPKHLRAIAESQGRAEQYTQERILEAAACFFDVEQHGRLGRRPLWRLIARNSDVPSD